LKDFVKKFHELRDVFIALGVHVSISLPRQHALFHYWPSIQLFGSPNGLCSSITESKHIKAVKEPWRRSSRYKALGQMLRTLGRLSKMTALRQIFSERRMLTGTTSSYTAQMVINGEDGRLKSEAEMENMSCDDEGDENDDDDSGPASGKAPSNGAFFDVKLAARVRTCRYKI
jgi:hypothetical protein